MSFTALTGTEVLYVNGVAQNGQLSGQLEPTTTAQIAALANTESAPFIVTPITTVGNGTLTAAGLVGGEIVRTGPVANFSDATDSAVNIIAALPGTVVGSSFSILIKNATAFTQTITAGVGVTLPSTVITPAFSVNNYIGTVASATTITLVHIDTTTISVGSNTTAPSITTISTVGSGTLTAAAFVGSFIARAGSQSGTPFTDTTDTAAAIIAACANLVNKIGTSMVVIYSNTTNALATVTGGSGVTVSGITAVPAGMAVEYLLTYTAAATLTMVGIGTTQGVSTAFAMAGSTSGETIVQPTAIASGTLTLPAATDTLVGKATTDTLTNKTLTAPTINGVVGGTATSQTITTLTSATANVTTAMQGPLPVAVGASLSITAAMAGATFLLNTVGGSTATLPAATGTGNRYKFVVTGTTTSAAHKILAASSSDFLNGNAVGHTSAGATLAFSAAAATAHSIQMPFAGNQPSGGFIGDYFEFIDVAANLWAVNGMYQAGTTATTPFSAATS